MIINNCALKLLQMSLEIINAISVVNAAVIVKNVCHPKTVFCNDYR